MTYASMRSVPGASPSPSRAPVKITMPFSPGSLKSLSFCCALVMASKTFLRVTFDLMLLAVPYSLRKRLSASLICLPGGT